MPHFYETLKPPPIETLAVAYLTPLVTPLRVLTRIPPNEPAAETIPANTYVTVQASSGNPMKNSILFNCQIVVETYAPFNDEIEAESNIGTALAWLGNAQGNTITVGAGEDWYVTYSQMSALPHRLTLPDNPTTKYLGAVMWRVAGKPIGPIG